MVPSASSEALLPTTRKPAKKAAAKKSAAKTLPNRPTGKPASADAYVASLPPDRCGAIEAVRQEINRRLPKGYEEGVQYGRVSWSVPHSLYPPGYPCDPRLPLPFACLASQKSTMSLYMMCVYGDEARRRAFEAAYAKAGKRLDMGNHAMGKSAKS